MTESVSIEALNVSKAFNRRNIFFNVSFYLRRTNSLVITGRNGSGKTTLLKIIAGVLSPSNGKIEITFSEKIIKASDYFKYIGFVSPHLQLYDEFTGWENLDIFRKVRNLEVSDDYLAELLKRFNLWERKNDYVRTYSYGMKQRLKYAFALIHKPPILLLDEPTSNLDEEGVAIVYQIMEEQKKNGILIVATNNSEDTKFCEQLIDLNLKSNQSSN